MGRGLIILAVFAVLIGVAVYCAPFSLRSVTDHPKAAVVERNEETATAETETPPPANSHATQPTVTALRKAETSSSDSRARDPVLVATPPVPTTPLATLPEKATSGFPLKPQKE